MCELKTNAEKQALKATELPAFEKVALQGLKKEVAEMLNMIGRTNEIFSTYTKHDISHINAMLRHLDWLIPPSTQKEMTPADWLLITLSIYFHDLGMLVTADEFETRMENEAFKSFLERLKTDPKSQDYIGRAQKMSPAEQDRFFFQEFIRDNHASRIKEWITGRHSRHWGAPVKPITEAIAELMKPFPARFRENLATVCESHHSENLNKRELYPLSQRYGNEPLEIANVQFAALILRTVDLIHVTKDRTPSIMFKTIKLSDPKGVDEWDKQKDTFAVRHAGRAFSPDDQSTHVITVSADFTEERPFFALTEYLAWADTEVRQTKRWSDQSREEKDAQNFWFPWQAVKGDLRVEGNAPQQMRFEFDRGRLLDLLVGHAIYNDATVAIRELLQNAIDAVRFKNHLDAKEAEAAGNSRPTMGKVSVTWDTDSRCLVVEDSGTGMDLDIIRYHLMRVGSSFYDTPQFTTEHKGFTPISRFGIGILTCFMISDDIEIVTLKSSCGYRIRMSSVHADYLLRELPLGDPKLTGIEPHGTRVTLVVREGVDLAKRTVNEILKYWIVLPECQVNYNEPGKPSEKIGFDSPVEALTCFYEENRKDMHEYWKGLEVTCKHRELGTGHYQMALAVVSGSYPEKTFARPPRAELPAVCIEGIRVSDSLPGFGRSEAPSPTALVSVRGVRSLRTTVSRSGLEKDEEYMNLGRICVEMLLDHITEEIARISEEKGNPLSRASTAGKWLTSDLASGAELPAILDHLEQGRRKLPLLVMETIESEKKSPTVKRALVSPETLATHGHFWTIESRLVDSLGIISRDLGRELSLNEFFASLAPEHMELAHSPVLPDASLFRADILAFHKPDSVRFSRIYQQTAIKWTPRISGVDEAKNLALNDDVFIAAVNQEIGEHHHIVGVSQPWWFDSKIAIAEISGDEENVTIVQTRLITLLAKGSEFARIWELVQNAIILSCKKKDARRLVRCLKLSNFCEYIWSERRGFFHKRNLASIVQTDLGRHWDELAAEANAVLTEYGFKQGIPNSIELPDLGKYFNASEYWRDWHRTEKTK